MVRRATKDDDDGPHIFGTDRNSFTGDLWADVKSGAVEKRIYAFVSGAADAVTGMAEGMAALLRPGGLQAALQGIGKLPQNVSVLWEHRKEFLQAFEALPSEEQARVIGRLTGEIELLLAGAAEGGGGAAESGKVMQTAEALVPAGGGAAALGKGGTISIDLAKLGREGGRLGYLMSRSAQAGGAADKAASDEKAADAAKTADPAKKADAANKTGPAKEAGPAEKPAKSEKPSSRRRPRTKPDPVVDSIVDGIREADDDQPGKTVGMMSHEAKATRGEATMGFAWGENGWEFLEGPSGAGGHPWNSPGFDGVVFKTGPDGVEIRILDNKAYKSTDDIRSASALSKNLAKNLENLSAELSKAKYHDVPKIEEIRKTVDAARDAARAGKPLPGNVKLDITTFGGAPTGVNSKKLPGVGFSGTKVP